MFDTITGAADLGAPYSQPIDTIHAFVDQHRDGLLNAAALLGGCRGARLTQTVIDGLDVSVVPSQRVMRAVFDLRDLLTLEHVHDPDREEAAHFAVIDPADACVEEICLLADGLCAALDDARMEDDRRAAA